MKIRFSNVQYVGTHFVSEVEWCCCLSKCIPVVHLTFSAGKFSSLETVICSLTLLHSSSLSAVACWTQPFKMLRLGCDPLLPGADNETSFGADLETVCLFDRHVGRMIGDNTKLFWVQNCPGSWHTVWPIWLLIGQYYYWGVATGWVVNYYWLN